MNLATWLAVLSICALGAMSPGPSLAVVLRHTLSGGPRNGCVTAITHGAGIGLYALLCISGLAFIVSASPLLFRVFEWIGAAYLAWLGVQGLMAKRAAEDTEPPATATRSAARDGFLIVFFNPKIAVFFIALFSQVIGPDTSLYARYAYAATAWLVDTAWYLLVAWLFSTPRWLPGLRHNSVWFERLFGLILLALAARLVMETIA